MAHATFERRVWRRLFAQRDEHLRRRRDRVHGPIRDGIHGADVPQRAIADFGCGTAITETQAGERQGTEHAQRLGLHDVLVDHVERVVEAIDGLTVASHPTQRPAFAGQAPTRDLAIAAAAAERVRFLEQGETPFELASKHSQHRALGSHFRPQA